MVYLKMEIEEGCKAVATVVMQLTIHQTMILEDDGREVMRITRVPSGWIYEVAASDYVWQPVFVPEQEEVKT